MRRLLNGLKRIRDNTDGNALIMLAAGMPVVLGGAGYAVDTAHLYLIKRELQYAADQAAISGAWAQGNGGTGDMYQTRAYQEFDSNLTRAAGLAITRTAKEENWDGGTDNSVRVDAAVDVTLPFMNMILDKSAAVSVTAKAYYDPGTAWQPCLLATHPTKGKALWFKGSINIDAGCGAGSLSNASNAILAGGNASNLLLNFILARGGIDDPHGKFSGQTSIPFMDDLFDPWGGLTPPNNPTDRGSDPCKSSPVEYKANVSAVPVDVSVTYSGNHKNKMQIASITENSKGATFNDTLTNDTTPYKVGDKFDSALNTYAVGDMVDKGKKASPRYVRVDQATRNSYTVTSASQTGGAGAGNALPGTYTDFKVSCNLKLASGVYVIDGGDFEMQAKNSISGSNVMIVLKNGAGIKINGGATVNLTPMSVSDLLGLGISAHDAKRMDGMLIFEDPNSSGNTGSKINGGAGLNLNGTVYLPKSDLDLTGNANVTSNCLLISAATITVSGNTDLSTFCPPTFTHSVTAAFTEERVRLVQ